MSIFYEKASKRESAVDIVVNNIKQLLIDRRLKPGDKLPSELEISEGLGVSRGSVREAMKILSDRYPCRQWHLCMRDSGKQHSGFLSVQFFYCESEY